MPAEEVQTALPLPALPTLYYPAPHSQAFHGWSPLTAQLSLCAVQRISTLHEQLLHQQYMCSLMFEDSAPNALPGLKAIPQAAPAAPNAAAPSTDDGQPPTEVTTEVNTGVTAEISVSRNAKVTTESSTQVDTAIPAELQELSDQVLQHAVSLLRPQTSSGSGSTSSSSTAAEQPEYWRSSENPSDFWLAMLLLLATLAMYAPENSLQSFLRQLISRSVPDLMLTCCSTSDTELPSASGSASEAAAARVIAACLEQPSFLEQSQLQQAWVQAIHQELLSVVTHLHSACASSFESLESPQARLGGTSKKRRKSQGTAQAGADSVKGNSQGLTPNSCGLVTKPDLHTVLMKTLQVVTPVLGTYQPAASEAATEAVTESDTAASGRHNSNSKAGGTAKKRKKVEPQSPNAAEARLRHVTGLLQHVALMPLAMLSPTHAALLAQVLLQTQLMLAQSAITRTTAAAAAVDAKADDIGQELMAQALVSSQQGIAKCLKGSSDAAMDLLQHAGPELWRWLPAVVQLISQLQPLKPLTSTTIMPEARIPHIQDSSSTLKPASPLHSLPAGTRRSPPSGSETTLCMLHSASTSMLHNMSAIVHYLACCCLAAMPASRISTTDVVAAKCTADRADTDLMGFQIFVTGLANELQVRPFVGCCIVHSNYTHAIMSQTLDTWNECGTLV